MSLLISARSQVFPRKEARLFEKAGLLGRPRTGPGGEALIRAKIGVGLGDTDLRGQDCGWALRAGERRAVWIAAVARRAARQTPPRRRGEHPAEKDRAEHSYDTPLPIGGIAAQWQDILRLRPHRVNQTCGNRTIVKVRSARAPALRAVGDPVQPICAAPPDSPAQSRYGVPASGSDLRQRSTSATPRSEAARRPPRGEGRSGLRPAGKQC